MPIRPPTIPVTGQDPRASAPGANDPWHAIRDEFLRALPDGISEGLLALDATGIIIHANRAARELLLRPADALIGQKIDSIFPNLVARAQSGAKSSDSNAASGGRDHSAEVQILRLGNLTRHLSATWRSLGDGAWVLFHDETRRVEQDMEIAKLNATMAVSQELLRHKNEELNASLARMEYLNGQLEQLDQLKTQFLDNTSHELRTPLNSIIGFLQLIREQMCDDREEEMECVEHSLQSAQHLLALINDVLDISKIEAGKMTLLINEFNVADLFDEVYNHSILYVQKKELEIDFQVRHDEPLSVRADFNKARQVLLHLIDNGIKFTEKGGIQVWAQPDLENSHMIRFFVQDSGIGIRADLDDTVFEKFLQIDGKSTRKYGGTGLGLALTRNLIEIMGGAIELQKRHAGAGTTISFTLPRGVVSARRPLASELDGDLDIEIDEDMLPSTF